MRAALRLGRVHLFGASYGGALALDVALAYPRSLRSLHVSSGFSSNALAVSEYRRLLRGLPSETREVLERFEGREDMGNAEYRAAFEVLRRKHYSRLIVRPYDLWYGVSHINPGVEQGRLDSWDVTGRLSEIRCPTLVTVGRQDVVTPKCARTIRDGIPGSELVVFGRSAHGLMYEERARFVTVYHDFLERIESRERPTPGGGGRRPTRVKRL